MESLSRHPQRRKHSASNGVSSKNPYGDVVLANGGTRKVFEAHEYAEIFGGPSSIPVFDLSSLDERVGLGEFRSSKLDYSDVFGGLRNDDVAVPYEELINGSREKSNPRILVGGRSSSKNSGFQHSSRKAKSPPGEMAGQSVDGVKQPLNLSSNSTSPRNGDASNEKKQEPSTYFVSRAPYLSKIDNDKPQPPPKHEVSRTWSFSAEVGAVKSEGGPSPGKSHDPAKLFGANEVNLKTQSFKVPQTATHPSNLSSSKGPRQTKASFASEEDSSGKPTGQWSPPLFEDEFDENSPAAISAAALKKAIDQAQESIRMAKMIMDRKKEGHRHGSKSRRRDSRNYMETKVDNEASAPNECNSGKEDEKSGALFSSVDGKSSPPISQNDTFVNAVTAGVQSVSKIPELEKSEPERHWKNLEANETHAETTIFPGFKTNEAHRTLTSGSGKVGNDSGFMLSSTALASNLGGQETVDQNNLKEPEVVAEVDKKQDLSSFGRIRELEKMVEETGQSNTNSDQVESPENIIELVESIHEQEKVSCKAGESMRITPADEVIDKNEDCADDRGMNEEKFNEPEIIDGEHLTFLTSKFGNLLSESCNVVRNEVPEQKDMEKKFQNVSEGKESLYTHEENEKGMEEKEALLWFESKEQQEETLEKEVDEEELDAFPYIDGVQRKVSEVFKPEFDNQKQNHADDANAPNLLEKCDQSKVEEKFISTVEYETAEAIVVDEDDGADAQKSEGGRDAHVMNNILDGTRKSTDDLHNCEMQEAEYEEHMDKAVDVNSSDDTDIGNAHHANDLSNQPQEACDADFHNKAEDYQEAVQSNGENSSVPEVTGTISPTDNDELEQLGLEVNEMHGIESLHRSASDEIFIENKLNNSFDGLSSDSEEGDDLTMHADPELNEKEDKDTFNPVSGILDAAQEYAADLPEVFQSEPETAEVDIKDAKQMPEQTSKCNTVSPLASSEEIMNGLSAHDSEGYPQDKVSSSIKEERKDEVEMFPKGRTSPEEESGILDAAQEYDADLPEIFQSEPGTAEFDIKDAKQMPEQTSKCNTVSPLASSEEIMNGLSAHDSEGYPQDKVSSSIKEEKKDEVEIFPKERTSPEEQSQALYSELSSESEEDGTSMEAGKAVEPSLNMEKDKENIVETSTKEDKDAKEGWQSYDRNHQQQRIEAIRRGREREREKLAAERAIREARERAFAEARERAERAAVERAAAEARKRYLAEAQEKLERVVAMEKQQADKASAEAKLKAERAAVERATAEARERAIEKAMSQKTSTEARPQFERSQTDRLSSSFRNDGLKHSLSSSDLDSASNTESAQRTKARLERNQRIAERAAQALEEKNRRDLLVQKEQAQRDRIAEYLDADIKRWSMGKEGNLRALLSTLHYILGLDSGWQPIPLTEIITTPAVKKAYRKATLYVHPDKLQQRGATIQQKYICEKVFDLLKAAWNRFNSEER